MINPIRYFVPANSVQTPKQEQKVQSIQIPIKEPEKPSFGLNLDYFTNNNTSIVLPEDVTSDDTPKRGRPPKKRKMSDGSTMISSDNDSPKYQTNEPYENSYKETDLMLRGTILQVDMLSGDIKQELDTIKSSKTLKKKYEYISELASTSSSLIGTKLSAIKEMNNVINNCHKLELSRIKELKLSTQDVDDDKRIMDMYSAFISTPVNTGYSLGPSLMDATLGNNIVRSEASGYSNTGDVSYDSYMNNLTPEQNRMIMEHNPNIETVVKYDQATGNRWFEVIDLTTGSVVPNMPVPSDIILADTQINVARGIARNANVDKTYKLMVIGQPDSYNNY